MMSTKHRAVNTKAVRQQPGGQQNLPANQRSQTGQDFNSSARPPFQAAPDSLSQHAQLKCGPTPYGTMVPHNPQAQMMSTVSEAGSTEQHAHQQHAATDSIQTQSLIRELHNFCEMKFEELMKMVQQSSGASSKHHQNQHPETSGAGSSRWSLSGMLGSGKCVNCETMKRQLEEKERENKRLAHQINAEVSKMQGNLGQSSIDECKRSFMLFFTNTIDKVMRQSDFKESELKRQITEQLCEAFQDIFVEVKSLLLAQIQQSLDSVLFTPEKANESSSEYNDFVRAYGRLLSACDFTGVGECPIKPGHLQSSRRIDDQEFLTRSIALSWKLLTTVPPLLPHCRETHTFDETVHEKVTGSCGGVTPGYKLKYSKPILTNCTGNVYIRGTVRSEDKVGGGAKKH